MSTRQRLSVAIVACNEAENIRRTLASLAPLTLDEIVLVDSGSTDGTLEIAREYNSTIYQKPWPGYGPGVNSALDLCTNTWILNLDADEPITPALAAEINSLLASTPQFDGYTIPRLNLIFGRWMRHGGLYPDRKLRLFRKGFARLEENTEPHATPKPITHSSPAPTGQLHGDILHYQYPTLPLYKEHMRRYANASVPLMLRRGKVSNNPITYFINTILNPVFTFLYNYIFRLGFLDGREGLQFHIHHSIYVRWKYQAAHAALKAQNK